MRQKLTKLKNSLLLFLELQLLISVMMLPILIAWGLPISIMTIVGNLVFAQFLTLFIFLSTILFACDLLGIPNNFIAYCLDWTTTIWHYFLSLGSAHWLIGYPYFMFPIASIIAIAACAIYIKKQFIQSTRILFLTLLCLCIPLSTYLLQPKLAQATIMQGAQKFHVIKRDGIVYAFDCGALGARPSSQSWIEYTLTSTMIKTMGVTHIDILVLCKSNSRTDVAVQALRDQMPVHKIVKIQ